MATGKQGFVTATEPQHSVSVQSEKQMHVQAPAPAMFIQAVSGLQSYTKSQPAAVPDAAVIPLSMPMMYANQPLPLLTLHIASGAGLQQQRPELPASSSRPKSAGKHVCLHCGRDCLKPSVLEKHLRCHTGERPYPCPTCGISFKTQSNLYKHKRTQAHARLCSESGKATFSSQESTDSSRENCSSPLLELQNEDSGDPNRNNDIFPAVTTGTSTSKEVKTGSETEWALCKAAVVGVIASPAHGQQVISHTVSQKAPQLSSDAAEIQVKSTNGDGRAPLTPNRTPLQRQEALFPKSQSHDSTDSGFSESSEQQLTSSPTATVSDASMDLEEAETSDKLSDVANDGTKSKVSLQKKQQLEKHILKLISENSVVMDDKQLVNVRPRKTVLSKQGSIDLPMPYTYKDSFHFEIRSSKHQVSGSQKPDRNGRAFYSSMPTQNSTSLEHAPLIRSSSLPFSMGIRKSDNTISPHQIDTPLSRRCSAGHINSFKSVDHSTPSHRSLVRQVAVDGLSAVEGSLMDRGIASSLSSEGDFNDTTSESAVKKSRRKKAEKFAYNKWYMYGGGTFKKLYNTEKDSVSKSSKKSTVSPEQTGSQGTQISQQEDSNLSASITGSYTSCPTSSLSPVLTAQTSSQVLPSYVLVQNTPMKQLTAQPQQSPTNQNVPTTDLNTVMNARKDTDQKGKAPETQYTVPIPSERKKQKTDNHLSVLAENTDAFTRMPQIASRQVNANLRQTLQSECADVPQNSGLSSLQLDNGLRLNRQGSFTNMSSPSTQRQLLFKRHSSPLFVADTTGTSASPSVSSSASSVSEAKTSFLPKYQLKIPVLTDGLSGPCLGKGSYENPSSPRQNVGLNQQSATTLPSSPQKQSHGQGQGVTSCISAITNAMSVTSSANAYTPSFTSTTPVSVAFPLASTELSVTTQSSISPVCRSSPSTKEIQLHAKNLLHAERSSVQDNLPSGVTPTPLLLSSKDGTPLEISSTEIQGSKDTFYVQTADLQIVMQLISDEQLALIEPQIETQAFKTNEGHCFLGNDPQICRTATIQTGISQEIHAKCSGDTEKKLAIDQRNVNRSLLSNIPDITRMSTGSAHTDHKAKSTKSAQDVYLTSTSSREVISRSPSKSKHDVLTVPDNRILGHQCKLSGSTPEDSIVPKDPETQVLSEKISKPLADKSTAKSVTEGSRACAHNQIMGNFSTSIICNNQQSCQEVTRSAGIRPTNIASTGNPAASSEGKMLKVAPPELSEKIPNLQPLQMTVQRDKPFVVTNTSCITGVSKFCILNPPPTPVSYPNLYEPIQSKSCQPSTTATNISSQHEPVSRVGPLQPSHQTDTCSGDKPSPEDVQSSTSGESGQPLTRQDWSKLEEVKTITPITAHGTESHGPALNFLKEEKMKGAQGPGGMLHVIPDCVTGPPVSCSVQSVKFHLEAETMKPKWIPLEAKNRGEDGTERVGTWDVKSTWKKQEEEAEGAMGNKKEEVNHKVLKTHPEISTSQHLTTINAASPELVSTSATAPVFGTTNPSSYSLTNKDLKGHTPKHIDQNNRKEKKYSSECCEKFPALSKDMKNLSAIQDEVHKETQTKNIHLTIMRVQSPERETVGKSNKLAMVSPCNKERNQKKNKTTIYTHSSFPIQTSSSCIHLNPSCTSSTHSKPPEPSASHGYMDEEEREQGEEGEGEEEEEEEERSSSSDDEGKLVIELE